MKETVDLTISSIDQSQEVKANSQITELIELDQTTPLIEENLRELEDEIVGKTLKHHAEPV